MCSAAEARLALLAPAPLSVRQVHQDPGVRPALEAQAQAQAAAMGSWRLPAQRALPHQLDTGGAAAMEGTPVLARVGECFG